MKLDNTLSELFDVEPVKSGELITKSGEVVVPQKSNQEEKIDYDYEKTRNNLHGLLQQGQEALAHALEVAKSSEHPRAFEVVGGLMKHISDINAQLMDLHDKKQKLEVKTGSTKKEDSSTTVTNNSIFLGSTTELSQLLKKMNIS
jgi:hypothetical protein